MKIKMPERAGWAAFAVACLTMTGIGAAYAASAIAPGPHGSYTGCVSKRDGDLRIVSGASQCRPNESVISLAGPQTARTVRVNCAAGQTIGAALAAAPVNLPLTVNVSGTCTEAVRIARDNVSLIGAGPGAGITAPDPSADPVIVTASQISLAGLTLTGGSTGILTSLPDRGSASFTASSLQINGADTGVALSPGTTGALTNVTVDHPGGHGGGGVVVGAGASLEARRLTISNAGNEALNVNGGQATVSGSAITSGSGEGVEVWGGGNLTLTNTSIEHTHFAVHATSGGTVVLQDSTITSNGGGVRAEGATAEIENSTVTGNGDNGVESMDGGRVRIAGSQIENNNGDGVRILGGSVATFSDTSDVISGNAGNGISVHDTSIAIFSPGDTSQIINNGGWGLFCAGPPSVALITATPGTVSGNAAGQDNCPVGS